jgi:hypothetical protein
MDGVATPTLQRSLAMDAAVSAPAAKRLTFPPEEDTKETPEKNKRSVGHDGIDEPALC